MQKQITKIPYKDLIVQDPKSANISVKQGNLKFCVQFFCANKADETMDFVSFFLLAMMPQHQDRSFIKYTGILYIIAGSIVIKKGSFK